FAARFESFGQLSPWTDWMMTAAASFCFALAAAHRMIDRVHRHAPHMWPAPLPASASRFSARHIHVIDVPHLPNCGETVFVNPSNFSGRHFHQGIPRLDVRQRRLLTGAASNLATATRSQFNIVNVRAEGNGTKR